LAGAVVFYNPSIQQYLNGSGYSGSLQHRFAKNRWSIFSRLNYQKNQLQYVDSNYLNIQGYLDNRYASSQVDGDFQIKRRIAEKDHIVVGFGAIHETTQSETLPQSPTRITQENLLGYQHDGKLTLNLQLGSQTIIESRKQTPTAISYLLPSLSIGYRFHPKYQIAIAYRYTNRQPTFSELYYQQIGNLELKTEKAQIASIRLQTRLHRSKWSFYGIIEPFYSEITDKILAIPTKNLFIWSILNIGRTRSYGVEVSTQLNYEFTNSTVGIHLNYTYLEALDITDPEGATYRHTLSYSPKNTGTVQLTWTRKQFTVFGQMHGLTSRYILNQNIPENELAGFYTLDAGVGYKLDFNKSALKFNIHIRNITNNYYSYINYFILPGINLQFRLTYVL
jgi:outer membrane receptor protein involved in Fe transport